MKNILFIMPWSDDEGKDRLQRAAGDCSTVFRTAADVTSEDISSANIIIGNVPPKLLHEPKLEFLQLTSAGADAYTREGILSRDTVLTCCTGAYSQTVAEHAFASTLMLQKDLHLYRDKQSAFEWAPGGIVSSMSDATVIVMGLGDIGCYYARMAKALGAHVIGVKRTLSSRPDCVDELFTTEQFDEIVGRGDVIVSFLPSTPATVHFYTRKRFEMMKPSAIFVNCGRGTAVAMDVLDGVLSDGVIRAAAVDVFETEPLPAESPLWKHSNLLLTPHSSGFFHLPATRGRVIDICAENLEAWLNGGKLKNVVDYNTGYAKKQS